MGHQSVCHLEAGNSENDWVGVGLWARRKNEEEAAIRQREVQLKSCSVTSLEHFCIRETTQVLYMPT